MKKGLRLYKWMIGAVFCLALFGVQLMEVPVLTLAEEAVSDVVTRSVTTEEQLVDAINDAEVDVIQLQEEITIARSMDGKDNAFVIQRPVTITGEGANGGLRLERAGIVLGGAVTFEHMSIYFANPVRNAIIANGYALTLNNVSNGGSSYNIDVFCGGITDYNGGNSSEIPVPGNEAKVVVKGSNTFTGVNATIDGGNIYAGSLSDVGSGAEDAANEYTGNVSIIIEKDASGIGQICAHGARENRDGGFPDQWKASADLYTVSGKVNIALNKCMNIVADGETGSAENATFTYKDDGRGYMCSPTLKNMSGIVLQPSGEATKAHLAPMIEGECNFRNVSVPTNTKLSFANIGAENISVSAFAGGGEIIFSGTTSQILRVTDEIAGITKVAVGGIAVDGMNSTSAVSEGVTYIAVSDSAAGEYGFELLPDFNNYNMTLENDGSGNWSTVLGESSIIIRSVGEIADVQITEDGTGANTTEITIPMNVTYLSDDEQNFLGDIPMVVTVNGKEATIEYGNMGYQYATGTTSDELFMGFSYEGDSEIFYIANGESYDYAVPPGNYEISMTIPGRYMEDGIAYTLSFTVAINKVHKHNWEFTAGNGAITAVCLEENCNLPVENVKMIIVVPNMSDLTYDGTAKRASVHVSTEGIFEVPVISYTSESGQRLESAPVNAGTYIAGITLGDADSVKTANAQFTILPKSLTGTIVSLSQSEYTYDGTAKKPGVTVTCNGKTLTEKDYAVSYNNNTNVGEAMVVVTGKGNYTGTITKKYTIIRHVCTHAWGKGVVTKKPTPAKKGIKTYTCNLCEAKKTEKIPALGAPKVGSKHTSDDKKAIYKVTKSHLKKGTVSYVAPKNKKKTTVTIPSTVKIDGVTYKVTAIEKNAFKNNKKIKSVTIGKNVEKIGTKAFYGCTKLKTLTINTTKLTKSKIGSKAFSKTPKSMKVKAPKKKLSAYQKILRGKGVHKKVKFKKL